MTFTSGYFPLFFGVLFLLYYLLPQRLQKGVLLLGCLLFYAFSGWGNWLLVMLMTLWSYLGGLWVEAGMARMQATLDAHTEWDKPTRKAYAADRRRAIRYRMLLIVFVLLGCLAFFKYVPTLIEALRGDTVEWLLPLGLSFFTFMTVGYVLDVYRGTLHAERSLPRYFLFACYFPHWIQGPISRYGELSVTLHAPARFDGQAVASGLLRVCFGYFKKLVVADTVLIAVGNIVATPDAFRGAGVALLLVLYSVQIYADFTGGMDIALGCSEMLGIRLCENFDHPFSSTSFKEYWRRWHISMGRWFTDYVFYPLSVSKGMQRLSRWSRRVLGERLGKRLPVWLATLITWLLTGIWHGAGWNFALWGLLNGLTILVAQELSPITRRIGQRHPRYAKGRLCRTLSCIWVFLLMGLYRTLDVYGDVPLTLRMWGSLVDAAAWKGLFTGAFWPSLGLSLPQWGLLLLSVLGLYLLGRITKGEERAEAAKWTGGGAVYAERLRQSLTGRPILLALLLSLLISATLILGRYGYGYDASQFIYNRF